jgi:type II secretory pathway pseudopilin PulG
MHKRAAFSVVELLIVMAIIADLAIIAIPAYARARRTAQNAALTNDIRILAASFRDACR